MAILRLTLTHLLNRRPTFTMREHLIPHLIKYRRRLHGQQATRVGGAVPPLRLHLRAAAVPLRLRPPSLNLSLSCHSSSDDPYHRKTWSSLLIPL